MCAMKVRFQMAGCRYYVGMRQAILTLCMLCLSLMSAAGQKTYVVSIGIADYKEINDLNLTENDVSVFNQLMQSQGAITTTLLSSKATHVNTISALRSSFARATKDDTMIFFFSGHGYEGGFCCWDMSSNSPTGSGNAIVQGADDRSRLGTANRSFGGLSYQEMQILFRNCRAGKKIVFADACYSGGLQKGEQLNLSVQSSGRDDVAFLLSSQPDETSLEMTETLNGAFTFFLTNGLRGEADADNNGDITIKEIYDYVSTNVSSYATSKSHSQHPVLWGRYDSDMVVFHTKN